MEGPPAKLQKTETGSASASSSAKPKFRLMLPQHFEDDIRMYLRQDMPCFDIGAFVVGDKPVVAKLLAKTDGVLAGVPFFDEVFKQLGCTVTWGCEEGSAVGPAQLGKEKAQAEIQGNADQHFNATSEHFKGRHEVAEVRGPAHKVLQGERTALNILSRASGIATDTQTLVGIKNLNGWHGEVAATRKVTPGFRLIEKYAVIVGGGVPHRMNLSDMTMLKDNHIWACNKSIGDAVRKVRSACGFSNKIEVECQSLEEAREAANAGAEVVMLDNFPPSEAKEAARKLKAEFSRGLTIEVSGGLSRETAAEYFSEHVDVLSFGSLTHGYGPIDFSLKIATVEGKAVC
mmetsp:Transcript_43516/g.70527  ORF Transcript_43516/g.70527 Transcript_43516/m.70527 type:complete len:345 (+) Transcript_43516:60-1094(+)